MSRISARLSRQRRQNAPVAEKSGKEVATPTGFEPAISALTGQYVKPLHHGAALKAKTGQQRCIYKSIILLHGCQSYDYITMLA